MMSRKAWLAVVVVAAAAMTLLALVKYRRDCASELPFLASHIEYPNVGVIVARHGRPRSVVPITAKNIEQVRRDYRLQDDTLRLEDVKTAPTLQLQVWRSKCRTDRELLAVVDGISGRVIRLQTGATL